MARVTLKSIIGKDGVESILTSISNGNLCIEDAAGKRVFGIDNKFSFEYSILVDDEKIGLVRGDEKALIIADLLNHFAKKEAEKKKLGAEVLNLYKEINVIFNFSEKLAQTIGAADICAITLDEAKHVINSISSVVIIWSEATKKFEVVASSDKDFFSEIIINDQFPLVAEIVSAGQSEIVSDTSKLVDAGIILPDITSSSIGRALVSKTKR